MKGRVQANRVQWSFILTVILSLCRVPGSPSQALTKQDDPRAPCWLSGCLWSGLSSDLAFHHGQGVCEVESM